jgi:hypothetical protein
MVAPVVTADADVAKILPPEYTEEPIAPVRDGLVRAHAAQQIAYQEKSDYAAEQADIGRARGRYLTGLGSDRGFHRQGSEEDEDFRARALAVPETVTPDAIVAAVNAILASVGAGECQYLESVADRLYVNATGGTGNYAGLLGVSPISPMRLYPEDAAIHGGSFRSNSSPGGAWVFGDHVGRFFILRVPNLASLDTAMPTPWSSSSTAAQRALGTGSLFPRNTAQQNQAFVYQNPHSALDVYKRIADTVSALVGQSVRWMMISDTRL